jgi:transcriptional regulator with XRE-family HTH domain
LQRLLQASENSYIAKMAISKWVDKRFGHELQRVRSERGWTQPQMAEKLSATGIAAIHSTTLAKIEAGTRSVRINEAVAIADLLDVSLDALLGRQRPDASTLAFAMTTVMDYARDASNQIVQARGTASDAEDQLEDAAERFESPHIEALQRAARGVAGHLDKAHTQATRLVHFASAAIVDAGMEAQ